MRLAVLWPRPRKQRWQLGRTFPDQHPDQSDALLFLEQEGFEVHIEESLGLPWNPLARMQEFYSGLDLVRALRTVWNSRHYDAIICVGDATSYFLVRMKRLLRLRHPLILIDPALSTDYPRRQCLQDVVLPQATRVVVFGRSQLHHLRERYGDRVRAEFLHHRADTDFYCPGAAAENEATSPSIFSIGNDYSRDFDTLAQAARLCVDQPGFSHRFVIHTSLPVTEAGPQVELSRGSLSFVELRERYRQASVVVIPLQDMIHAGGINSLLEAMACGRPVIVSGSRGITDYISDGQTARVVSPGDPVALAEAIQALLASPSRAAELGEGARQFVVNHCDNRTYAHKLGTILRNAMPKK